MAHSIIRILNHVILLGKKYCHNEAHVFLFLFVQSEKSDWTH